MKLLGKGLMKSSKGLLKRSSKGRRRSARRRSGGRRQRQRQRRRDEGEDPYDRERERYNDYAPQDAYYAPQDDYDEYHDDYGLEYDYYYDERRRKNYPMIVLGVGLVVVNVCAMIAMTCTDPVASPTRAFAAYVYGWINTIAWTMIAVGALSTLGIIGLYLKTFLLRKAVEVASGENTDTYFLKYFLLSSATLATGITVKFYGGDTLEAIKDEACDKEKDKTAAWQTTGGLTLIGITLIFLGMSPNVLG